ncbi:MAG: hypothetical protein HYS27_21120 [Deltaproteobacteria bacterium]|nr:hypothetical protein [Deltaproteobacteria bacterium]
MASARHDPKGFVLIIVAVCGIAMVVIAMAIVVTGGAGQMNAIKDVSTDRSITIAESGLQRATAYATAITAAEKDFDKALDPSLSVNCGAPASPIAPGTPRYADAASTVQWPSGSGITYQVVAFNDGAYLTRFDDDFDDMLPNAQLGAFSGNNPVNGCAEGPGVINNPFRDRNRAVWVSVIGIYPGTDPATAKHHTSLRRFYVANAATPPHLIRVGGDLTTGHLMFCSESGDIAVYGDATLSNQTDTCGTVQVQGTIANSSQAADCSGYGLACSHGTDTGGIAFPGSLSVPSATDPAWFTWSSGCNFYVDASGLYFWDAATPACAARGGGPPPSTDSCWIPLIYVDGGGAPRNALGWADIVEGVGTADWRPHATTAATLASLPPNGPQTGRVFGGGPPSHPQWSTCQGATAYTWRPPGGGTPVGCQQCTLGTDRAASFNGAAFSFNPADPEAVPAGVYFIDDDHAFATMGMGLPGTDANEGEWPQATIIVNGDATFSGSGRVGIGTAKGPAATPAAPATPVVPAMGFPSLVVGGDLSVSAGANWAFGGAVWVDDDATFAGGSNVELYGPLTVGDDLTIGGGGKLDVVLTTEMVQPLASNVLVAATGSRTLR